MRSEVSSDFLCPICGESHVLATAYSSRYPQSTADIPKDEIERRIVMTADQCVIDSQRFYLRGRIPIPIRVAGGGTLDEPFIWGVWAEVSPKNFMRTNELWNAEGRENEPPFRGYLDNELTLYGRTLNLEVDVQTRPVGQRPHFHVTDGEHQIALEQRDGISLPRLEEITVLMHHPR